ncbi:MAG: exo-alpha-sialidase [Ruminococcaceae bacterium]|nr:exo-alpha-sialidase [Oscillospiraceae bacterium]
MKCNTKVIRKGFDKEKCFVHPKCCYTKDLMITTAQYLTLAGSDLFSGIYMSKSTDEGKTWSELTLQKNLKPIIKDGLLTVCCDATPFYHKKTGKIIIIGHTASYEEGKTWPTGKTRYTFYSIYDREKDEFLQPKFLEMPKGFENCGSGCSQYVELNDGNMLIPVYYALNENPKMFEVMVLKCSFDGENLKLLEMGAPLSLNIARGLCEPSVILHNGAYYITIRNDECGLVAKSEDGLNYTDLQLWKWEDGSILENYNTQQHFMEVNDNLYLVYTRRGLDNDHVFRHRAPLVAARVENMRVVKDSEFLIVPNRGARLGNFCAAPYKDKKSLVMVSEWMQPIGCEKYGSDNSLYLSIIEE